MNLTKRTFLGATLALALTPLAALAEGGDNPMPGIDIIIEKDPSVETKPVMEFSLTDGEIKEFNGFKGKARSDYLARIITRYLLDLGPKASPDELHATIAAALGDSWCGPCRMVDGAYINRIKLPGEGLIVEVKGTK